MQIIDNAPNESFIKKVLVVTANAANTTTFGIQLRGAQVGKSTAKGKEKSPHHRCWKSNSILFCIKQLKTLVEAETS